MARVIVEIRTGGEVLRFENTANKNRWGDGRLTELRAVVETLESITSGPPRSRTGFKIDIDGQRHCTCLPKCCYCSDSHDGAS